MATVDLVLENQALKIVGVAPSPDIELLEAVTGTDIASAVLEYMTIRLGLWKKKVCALRLLRRRIATRQHSP